MERMENFRLLSDIEKGNSPYEANISDGGNPVHVVFNVSRTMHSIERGGGERSNVSPPHPHTNSQLNRGYFM
jgi:hypothetical protein